jgi:eukaryotic-like serine/threonine-protein kinase
MSDPVRLKAALADRYRIESELGQGGMATVYLADDLRHHRKVAIKVLRPDLTESAGTARFLREIDLVSPLQHPHIVPLLESGSAAGALYFVMPLVEGESLRQRLARVTRLPVAETIRILVDVADALAYAHARGVVHRDIKPDNILLSGRHALVTDFGVAKAIAVSQAGDGPAGAAPLPVTVGVALGTPAYMAPEQATADPSVDQRADLYALGIIGYEMLAGRPPFSGRSPQEVLAAQILDEPEPLLSLRPDTPPLLATIIERCLAKRREERWPTAEALLAQLEPLAAPSGGNTPERGLPARPGRRLRPWLALAGVACVAAALWFVLSGRLRTGAAAVGLGRRTRLTLDPGLELDPALSPDGTLLAYAAGPPGRTRILLRQLSGGDGVPVTHDSTDAFRRPQWSPDGSRLLVRSRRGIELVPALGGPRHLVVAGPRGKPVGDAAWSPDGGSIAYAIGDSLFVLGLETGVGHPVAEIHELHSINWSPDGRWIAGVSGNLEFMYDARDFGNLAPSQIVIAPPAGGPAIAVTDSLALNASPVWLGPSRLLFVSSRDGGRDLYTVALDQNGHPRGGPARVTTGLSLHQVAVSGAGKMLAWADLTETVNIWRVEIPARGTVSLSHAVPVTRENQVIESFAISPDGRWVAFDSDRRGHQHLFRQPLAGGEAEQLTQGDWDDFYPRWSPDGGELAFHSFRDGNREIFTVSLDDHHLTRVTDRPEHDQTPAWRPDGLALAFQVGFGSELAGGSRLDVTTLEQGHWQATATVAQDCRRPAWSPDGRWILCVSAAGGLRLIQPAGGAARILVSPDSGRLGRRVELATWSEDGRTVWYEAFAPEGGSGIWAIPAAGGESRPVVRFDDPDKQATRYGLAVRGEALYLTVGLRQSDIWAAELSGGF